VADEPVSTAPENKNELLAKLRDQVKEYVTSEKLRLITERTFLKSVLESSLGSPEAKEKKYNEVVVIENVKKLIGIVNPTNK